MKFNSCVAIRQTALLKCSQLTAFRGKSYKLCLLTIHETSFIPNSDFHTLKEHETEYYICGIEALLVVVDAFSVTQRP